MKGFVNRFPSLIMRKRGPRKQLAPGLMIFKDGPVVHGKITRDHTEEILHKGKYSKASLPKHLALNFYSNYRGKRRRCLPRQRVINIYRRLCSISPAPGECPFKQFHGSNHHKLIRNQGKTMLVKANF